MTVTEVATGHSALYGTSSSLIVGRVPKVIFVICPPSTQNPAFRSSQLAFPSTSIKRKHDQLTAMGNCSLALGIAVMSLIGHQKHTF